MKTKPVFSNDDHVRLVIDMILEHSSDPHNQETSFELCEEIVYKIPTEQINKKVLVVSSLEFLYAITKTAKSNTTIYFATPCDIKARLATQWISPQNIFTCTGVLNNEGLQNMKFDVVIGNPPFNSPKQKDSTRTKQLYTRFVHMAISLAPLVSFIIPSLWADKPSKLKKTFGTSLRYCCEVSDHFDINVPTCAVLYDHKYDGPCMISNSSGESFSKDVSDGVYPLHGNLLTHTILTKVKSSKSLGMLWYRSKVNRNDVRLGSGTTQLIETVGPTSKPITTTHADIDPLEFTNFNSWKVIVGNVGEWSALGVTKIAPPNIATSYSVVGLTVDSEREAINLLQYLESTFVRALVAFVKNNTPNSKTVLSNIPAVDLSRTWTDQELYKYFNLNIEEINLIEGIIK